MRGPLRGMVASFLTGSRIASRYKRFDWPLILGLAGIVIALWIVLALR